MGYKYTVCMIIKKAYKFRLRPNEEQQALLMQFAGHTRFAWNKGLSLNRSRLERGDRIMYYHELDFWSKLWKRSEEFAFLKDCPAHLIQQKLRDLDRAFRDGFDTKQPGKRMPRFKRRGSDDSFRFPAADQVKLEYRHVTFPKLGRMRFYRSRAINSTIKNYTVLRKAGHWYMSIQVELKLDVPSIPASNAAIGLDLGIAHFVTSSEGMHYASTHSYRKSLKKLAKMQRSLSRKQKGSSNWKKQRRKISRLHHHIANQRYDSLHKLSTELSKNHAMIAVEKLQVKNMSRSARGSMDSPGVQVAAKAGLNRSILDQGWSQFRQQLSYKMQWRGGLLVEVDPKYTSQRCHGCDHVAKANRKSQSCFVCEHCHMTCHADVNAAKNILAAGHAELACGASAVARL